MKAHVTLVGSLVLLVAPATAQLNVLTTQNPAQLVQNVLLGGGVTASNFRYNGVWNPATNQTGSGSFTATNSNLGLDAGVILSTGEVASDAVNFITGADGNSTDFASSSNGTGSDADLVLLSGQTINDRGVLEFDFIPTGDSLKFRYVFGSEEYTSFTCTQFFDVFGFFLSGPGIAGPYQNNAINIALVPGGNVPVGVNSVNGGVPTGGGTAATCAAVDPNWQANSIYFVDNGGMSGTTVTYDGFTTVLTAFALVQCGVQYHIKLAIGDASDSSYDSGVFLEAGSFTSTGSVIPTLAGGVGINGNTMLEGCSPVELIFTRLGDTTFVDTVDITVTGTATAGLDYSPALPAQLIFAAGSETASIILDVPIDPDGPETIVITIEQLIDCAGIVLQTVFTFIIDSPPPLDVQSIDINSICGQNNLLAPVVSGGMGQYTYAWNTGDTTPTINASPAVTTTYTVTVSDVCGIVPVSADFTITLPIYPPLSLDVTSDTLIDCLGNGPISAFNVAGGDGNFNYAWSVGGVVIGNAATLVVPAGDPVYYLVSVGEGCGTSIQDSVLVGTVPLPAIEITTAGDRTVICTGDSTLLEITGITGGNSVYTWTWTDENGNIIGNGWTIDVPVPADQAYTITVNDQCGYQGVATVNSLIPHYAPFQLEMVPDHVLCAGNTSSIHSLVTGGSGYYRIQWAMEDSLTDPLYWVTPDEETTYAVTVTDQCGEVLQGQTVIDVEHVSTHIVVTNKGQDDWQLNAATLPYARTWIWDMGDGTRYRNDEVTHSYLDLEDHWVTLKIVTPNGCLGVDSVLLSPPAHIFFPNAFTPDGDNHNELFGPIGHSIDVFEMTIFDRWGQVVFATDDVTKQWDGSVNGGGQATTGVYVYKYRAEGHYFPSIDGMGHVTLIRGSQQN